MKKLIFLFSLFVALISCTDSETLSIKNAPENAIAFTQKDGALELLKPSYSEFKDFLEGNSALMHGAKLNYNKKEVVTIEGKPYLRMYSGDLVSTTALEPISGNGDYYVLGRTTCSSSACSSGGGCMPQSNGYCSPCNKGLSGGDCTRSTSISPS